MGANHDSLGSPAGREAGREAAPGRPAVGRQRRARPRAPRVLVALVVAAVSSATVLGSAGPAAADTPKFGFYLAPPFVQTPYYTATVQDFDGLPLGAATTPQTWAGISATDGVTGTWTVSAGGDYGGATTVAPASPGAPQPGEAAATRSQYASAGTLDIRLASPATCLGFWWSAGDSNNTVTVYTESGTKLVATLTTAGLTTLLGTSAAPSPVRAIDNTEHNASGEYFGHPVTATSPRSTPNEPFAYVHAISSGGVTFDRIVLQHAGGGSGFEFDNVAITRDCTVSSTLVIIDEDLLDPTFEAEFIAANTAPARPTPPTLSCTPDPVAPVALVTCEISGGPALGDILWNATLDGPFAGQGVTLDADGRATFTFTAPAGAAGRSIRIALIGWDVATSVGVTGMPIPTSVPAGEGPFETSLSGPLGPLGPLRIPLLLGVLTILGAAVIVTRRFEDRTARRGEHTLNWR
jgi:hypothetical protein